MQGVVAGIVAFVVGSLLYMNPLTSGIYEQNSDWPELRLMDSLGGGFVGAVVVGILIAVIYDKRKS